MQGIRNRFRDAWVLLLVLAISGWTDKVPPSQESMRIMVDQAVYDCGEVFVGSRVPVLFLLRNGEDSDLTIENVTSSCPCLEIIDYPQRLLLGAEGALRLLLSAGEPGAFSHEISLSLLSPDSKTVKLTVQGRVVERCRAPELWMAVTQLQQRMADGAAVMLVDVRSKKDFQKQWIPGSLNVPLHLVKTKYFLKGRRFVLVDQGYPSLLLEDTCRQLREAGFEGAYILDGGLRYWVKQGGAIKGSLFDREGLQNIPARLLLQHQAYRDVSVLNLTGQRVSAAGEPVPGIFCEYHAATDEYDLSGVFGLLKPGPSGLLNTVVLLTSDGERCIPVETALSGIPQVNIFYVDRGLDGYLAGVAETKAITRGAHKLTISEKKYPPCLSCP